MTALLSVVGSGVVADTSRIAPLTTYRGLDTRGWLNRVSNISFQRPPLH